MTPKTGPKFSVLMCNFNYGDYIAQAITSVLEQTFGDYELIIVDDGSSDHSLDEISRFSDQRIKRLFQKNQGQAAAFNNGMKHCEGEFVAFLDSDDWWAPQKLEAVLWSIEASNLSFGLIQHQMTVWFDGKQWPYKRVLPSGDCFEEMKITGNLDFFVPTSGIVIPIGVCKKIFPVPIALKLCADAFLTRTSTAYGPLLSLSESLGFYRKHSNSVFQNKNFDDISLFNQTLIPELLRFYERNGFSGVEIADIPGQKSQKEPPRRPLSKRVFGRMARIFHNLAEG